MKEASSRSAGGVGFRWLAVPPMIDRLLMQPVLLPPFEGVDQQVMALRQQHQVVYQPNWLSWH